MAIFKILVGHIRLGWNQIVQELAKWHKLFIEINSKNQLSHT